MIIDFVGPTGAGKSTLIAAVADVLRDRSVETALRNAHGKHDEHGRKIHPKDRPAVKRRAVLARPGLFAACFTAYESDDGRGLRQRLREATRTCQAVGIYERAVDYQGVVLVDEGLLKPVAFLGPLMGRRRIRRVVRRIPLPDLCVVVNTPPELASERVVARDGRLRQSATLKGSRHRRYDEGVDMLAEYVQVLRLDGVGDVTEQSHTVAETVCTAIRSG